MCQICYPSRNQGQTMRRILRSPLSRVPLLSPLSSFLSAPSIPAAAALCVVFFGTAQAVEDKADRVRGAVYGALVADALCLGSHYEYDAPKIKKAYGGQIIDKFLSPGEYMGGQTHGVGWGARKYHPGKTAGGNTDYGDSNLYLLEWLGDAYAKKEHTPFSIEKYVNQHWRKQYEGRHSGNCRACGAWIDTMTKTTTENLDRGVPLAQAGGMSNGQIVRFAGALAVYESEDELVRVARATTEFTNRNPQPIDASEFWARAVFHILNGKELEAAIQAAADSTSSPFIKSKVKQAIDKVKEATDPDGPLSKEEFVDDLALTSMARLWEVGKTEPIKVGKASPTEGTLPGAVYFILKYKDFKTAAQANAMVGGDNASRSIPIGIVLGAWKGMQGIPKEWVETLTEGKRIGKILASLPVTATDKAEL